MPPQLYTPNQVLVATLVGSPLAGTWLLGSNYRSHGRPREARNVLLAGIAVTAGLFLASLLVPKVPDSVFPIAAAMAMRQATRLVNDEIVARSGAGERGRWGRAMGVGVAGMGVYLAAVFVAVELGPDALFHRVRFPNGDEIELRGDATAEEARALEPAVRAAGYFGAGEARTVTLGKEGAGYTLAMIVVDRDLTEDELLAFRSVGAAAGSALGAPVEVRLTGEFGLPRYVLRPE